MRPGDDSQEGNELRVTDRRRFSADGNMRDGSEAEAEAAQPPPAPEPAAPAQRPQQAERVVPAGADGAAQAQESHATRGQDAVYDLGIEAVFYVFYQSALIALGATQPGGPPGRVDLAEARQAITFLQVLEQKTRGNLTPDEAATLRELLTEAQMAFVQVARSAGSQA